MKESSIRQLRNYPNHFIHCYGYVIKVKQGKECVLKNEIDTKSKFVYVNISGIRMNVLYLLIEHFMPGDLRLNEQYDYSIAYHSNGMPCIPYQSVKVKGFSNTITDLEHDTIQQYGCKIRADNANLRGRHKITSLHVANALITNNFRCIYCGDEINKIGWHLDHFLPLSLGGLNKFENLVCSCRECNMMKSNLKPVVFYKQITKIFNNYKFRKPC